MAEYKDVATIKTKIQKICDNCWHPYRLGGCPEHCGINDALKAIDSVPPAQPVNIAKLQPNCNQVASDCISRQAALDALGEEPPVWYDGEDEIAERDQWRRDVAAIKALPSAQLAQDLPNGCTDTISRQAAIDAIERLEIPEDMCVFEILSHIELEIGTLPSSQPERTCVNCGRTVNNGGWYADGGTRCPIEEHYALPKDGYCHLWEKRNVTDDDYPERRTDERFNQQTGGD